MIMSPCCQGEHHFCYEEGLVCHIDELYYLWQWASLNTRDSAVSLTMTRSCHEDSDDHDYDAIVMAIMMVVKIMKEDDNE